MDHSRRRDPATAHQWQRLRAQRQAPAYQLALYVSRRSQQASSALSLNRRMTTSKELYFCFSGKQLRPSITSVSKRVLPSSGEGQLSISLGDGKGH